MAFMQKILWRGWRKWMAVMDERKGLQTVNRVLHIMNRNKVARGGGLDVAEAELVTADRDFTF